MMMMTQAIRCRLVYCRIRACSKFKSYGFLRVNRWKVLTNNPLNKQLTEIGLLYT